MSQGNKVNDFCREWSAEERAVWRERDGQEQAELAGHANAPTTPQDLHLPGMCTEGYCHMLSGTGYLVSIHLVFHVIDC